MTLISDVSEESAEIKKAKVGNKKFTLPEISMVSETDPFSEVAWQEYLPKSSFSTDAMITECLKTFYI